MAEVPIQIPEGDEPLLVFTVAEGGLTGATVKWVAKANEETADSAGDTINGTVTSDTTFTIQVEDTSTGAGIGFTFYKVVVIKSAHPVTVQYGPLIIGNV